MNWWINYWNVITHTHSECAMLMNRTEYYMLSAQLWRTGMSILETADCLSCLGSAAKLAMQLTMSNINCMLLHVIGCDECFGRQLKTLLGLFINCFRCTRCEYYFDQTTIFRFTLSGNLLALLVLPWNWIYFHSMLWVSPLTCSTWTMLVSTMTYKMRHIIFRLLCLDL